MRKPPRLQPLTPEALLGLICAAVIAFAVLQLWRV